MDLFVIDSATSPLCLSFLSVMLFCLACVQFLRVVTTPLPAINRTGYARSALRVAKAYKATAWGILVGVFLTALVISFADVFARL